MAFLLLVTWVPGILLLIVQALFAGSFTFVRDNLYLFPAITLFSFLQVVMVSAAMLALSSLSNSSRYVGILYAALMFFTQALFSVLRFVTGGSGCRLDVVRSQPRPDRQRDLPPAPAATRRPGWCRC